VFVASGAPRYKLIACEILYRELCYHVALSPNIVDLQFLPKGLHDLGEQGMSARLQQAIDAVEAGRYRAILLGYALCNNGIRGLRAPLPMIVPRAHDCITLLLGSRQRYREAFEANPGTYFESTGWLERNEADQDRGRQLGLQASYEDYARKYGEDNARYLVEGLGDGLHNYSAYAYIATVGEFRDYERLTREDAQARGWSCTRLEGEPGLLRRLVDGPWEESEFLVVPPGSHPAPSHDEGVLRAE